MVTIKFLKTVRAFNLKNSKKKQIKINYQIDLRAFKIKLVAASDFNSDRHTLRHLQQVSRHATTIFDLSDHFIGQPQSHVIEMIISMAGKVKMEPVVLFFKKITQSLQINFVIPAEINAPMMFGARARVRTAHRAMQRKQ